MVFAQPTIDDGCVLAINERDTARCRSDRAHRGQIFGDVATEASKRKDLDRGMSPLVQRCRNGQLFELTMRKLLSEEQGIYAHSRPSLTYRAPLQGRGGASNSRVSRNDTGGRLRAPWGFNYLPVFGICPVRARQVGFNAS